MRWTERPRILAAAVFAWIAIVTAAFYRENGDYLVTKIADFLRYARSFLA